MKGKSHLANQSLFLLSNSVSTFWLVSGHGSVPAASNEQSILLAIQWFLKHFNAARGMHGYSVLKFQTVFYKVPCPSL